MKPNQVLPWKVINDVRTSLSAIRFLLFHIQNKELSNEEIQDATTELYRLEKLFQDLEQLEDKDVPLHHALAHGSTYSSSEVTLL